MSDTVKKIILRGDPKSPESADYYIEFPGGGIGVTRVNGSYWAHITVNHRQAIDGADDLNGAQADITDARLDYDHGIEPIADLESLYHVAVRIAVRK